MNSFLFVGGGNSSYISALILNSRYPNKKITIVESEAIGIIGVGEGTTEHWFKFCECLGISFTELIEKCDATYKFGVHFKNWVKDDYYHCVGHPFNAHHADYLAYAATHLVKRTKQRDTIPQFLKEGMLPIPCGDTFGHQLHFDSVKLNDFLLLTCLDRGISIVNDEINDATFDRQGNIASVNSKTETYKADFYIDGTGFKRTLIQKILGVKWDSYSDHLFMNSAITWHENSSDDIPLFTTSEALKNGWKWTIPTQNKKAYGYIFSDKFCSVEEAKEEVNVKDVDKVIKFEPGKMERMWYKNCMAIGLSAGFFEPIEATSLGITIQQMFCFLHHISSNDSDSFNKYVNTIYDNAFNFILLHYYNVRKDSEFWRFNNTHFKKTEFLENLFDIMLKRLPFKEELEVPWGLFGSLNFIQILYGLNHIDISPIKKEYQFYSEEKREDYNCLINQVKNADDSDLIDKMLPHRDKLLALINK